MRLIPFALAALPCIVSQPVAAAQTSVTCYLDGARVEREAAAVNGYLEYELPDSLTPGSLRVKPLGGGSVLRVELVPADRDRRRARELARLEERRGELQDRMQALSRRREIFSAAAKAQSGKGPRKTRDNPDPLHSIRQGTEFALAQLDSVQRSERRCRGDLEALEREAAALGKGAALARIWLSGGRARLSYQVGGDRWTPCYDLRWSGDAGGELLLHARLPKQEKGVRYLVSKGTVAQGLAATPVRGDYPVLARYPLTLQGTARGNEPPLSFAFSAVEPGLPAGEGAAFWRGEYLGSAPFSGGGATEFHLGRQ